MQIASTALMGEPRGWSWSRAFDREPWSARSCTGPVEVLLEPGFPQGEDLLQFIWEQGLYRREALRTTDGREVEVVKPGRIQHNSGPDLVGAEVRINGQLWAGTVEVHLRSSEWNAHGHQHDPAYENVVLHVVYQHDAEVRTPQGHVLPTVELISRIPTERITAYKDLMRSKGFVPCERLLGHLDPDATDGWLEEVLVQRMERKAAEVAALYRQLGGDPMETFHHLLARAFGQQVNAAPFGMLAHALPLRILHRYRDDHLRMEALLFGQAGLLQVDLLEEYPRRLQQEYALLARLHGLRPMPVAAWKFGRMRPVNLPTVRIAQWAALIGRCDGSFAGLLEAPDAQALHRLLEVEAGPYWKDHYTFDRPSAPAAKRLGRAGAQHLIINAVVPMLYALGRAQGRQQLCDRALHLLRQLPPERNGILERWAALGLEARDAARGQALLELRNVHCAARRCLTCGIGNQLLKRSVYGSTAQ